MVAAVFSTEIKFTSAGLEDAMAENKLRFRTMKKIDGRAAGVVAAITPPVDVQEWFGTRARVPILGTINGVRFRSWLMPMGGCHRMPVNRTLCRGARVGRRGISLTW